MQIFLNGLVQGLVIALAAMGFAVIYNSTGILHIAQGAIYAFAPFFFLLSMHLGIGLFLSVVCALSVSIALSAIIEHVNHRPLQKKEASLQIHLISSLGIYIAFIQVVAIIWGNEIRVLTDGLDAAYKIFDVILTKSQVFAGIISVILIGTFFYWLKKTNSGLKFLALSDNPIQLALYGYDVSKLRLLAFGLSGLLTGSASMLSAMDTGFGPQVGLNAVLVAIVATIVGGKGSFLGPVIGGILLGVVRSQVVWYTSPRWQDAITFLILVLFLFFRPQGIIGEKGRIETL